MDMRQALGSSEYFKAADVSTPKTVYISHVTLEKVGKKEEQKHVLHFQQEEQRLILNVINTKALMKVLGNDSDYWTGCKCELYEAETEFQGDIVPCVRVRNVKQSPEMQEKLAQKENSTPESNDIPF